MKKIILIPSLLTVASMPLITLSACNKITSYNKTICVDTTTNNSLAYQIIDEVKNVAKQNFTFLDSAHSDEAFIILDKTNSKVVELTSKLANDEYQIKYDNNQILIAAKTGLARSCAVQRLLKDYLTSSGFNIPKNLDVKGTCKASDYVTEIYGNVHSSVEADKFRDPFIYREGSTYYMVATSTTKGSALVGDDWWHLWRATKAFNDKDNEWEDLGYIIDENTSKLIKGDRWAPELYKYTNPDTNETKYYIFTTFATSSETNEPARGRGCAVFCSDKLVDDEGKAAKFELISYRMNGEEKEMGRITNHAHSCIDGHLYIENNIPYMVYVREFTDFNPQVGRMCVAQMSNDLTHFVSEPIDIFSATDAPWVSHASIESGQFRVTDGPFIHKMSNGQLVMLWSSYYDAKSKQYCMGYATADKVAGPWTQHQRLMYDEFALEGYESPYVSDFSLQGGHGMIFTDTNNKMYMCIHCGAWDKKEHPFIFPIKEQNGLLEIDLY